MTSTYTSSHLHLNSFHWNRLRSRLAVPLVVGLAGLFAWSASSGPAFAGRCELIGMGSCFSWLAGTIPPCLDDSEASSGVITGTDVAERICGDAGASVTHLYGEGGDDRLDGSDADEFILAGDGSDQAWGRGGNDLVHGSGAPGPDGDDKLFGNEGDDTVRGGPGNDELHGGSGNDNVWGDNDRDVVYGESGNDDVRGGSGDDDLIGGPGNDTLRGGFDNDLYLYDLGHGHDTVIDAEGHNVVLFRGLLKEHVTRTVIGDDLRLDVAKDGTTGSILIEDYAGGSWSIAFEDQPNFILIFADDLGYGDIEPFRPTTPPAGQRIYTPNLLRMAAEGTKLTQFYSGADHCPPARSSLLQGLHTGNTAVNSATNNHFVDETLPILPGLLRDNGYRSAVVGKWGMAQHSWSPPMTPGGEPSTTIQNGDPVEMGFDRFLGVLKHRDAHTYYLSGTWSCPTLPDPYDPFIADIFQQLLGYGFDDTATSSSVPSSDPNAQPPASLRYSLPPTVYTHDEYIARGLEVIDDWRGDGPFFLYLPLTIPHAELTVPTDAFTVDDELGNEHVYTSEITPDVSWRPCQCDGGPAGCTSAQSYQYPRWNDRVKATYAAMVSRLDQGVGQILDRLVELRLDHSTVVLLTSDNGPHQEGGMNREFFDSNLDFKGGKNDLYEGGIRVPFLAWRPGTIAADASSDEATALFDLLPTLAEMASISSSEVDTYLGGSPDGVSLAALLETPASTTLSRSTPLYWEHAGHTGLSTLQAVRDGKWKAVRLGNDTVELYDLETDRDESSNVASSQCTVLRSMIDTMNAEGSDEVPCLCDYPAICPGTANGCTPSECP
ncbi:MAG: sulfatase-like hydrolase/transferase [Acidobacteriota bacterium]